MSSAKHVHVVGGGTVAYARAHLALCAPAYGTTAREIAKISATLIPGMPVSLHLTKMADHISTLETVDDLKTLVYSLVRDEHTKIVFWNPAVVDFSPSVGDVPSGKYATRLKSREQNAGKILSLTPTRKLVGIFRNGDGVVSGRKDIFLVATKATAGSTPEEQYRQGLHLLKESSANLVLANDTVTRLNMVIVPEEATYHVTTNRQEALTGLVEMAHARARLTFTRSTVVPGEAVSWNDSRVPETLRTVVNHCIQKGAYKPFRGVTAGHFAVKLGTGEFLTSRRKQNFNHLDTVGLVRVVAKGRDQVVAYGSKPSVGGQSQRIVFDEHPEADCIVHFHSPKKTHSLVPTIPQREYECGSHECGQNTSRGLKAFELEGFTGIAGHTTPSGEYVKAVYLDEHGPNIVFSSTVNPYDVIAFIDDNFDLSQKTGSFAIT